MRPLISRFLNYFYPLGGKKSHNYKCGCSGNKRNLTIPTERIKAYCLCCGNNSYFESFEPLSSPCKRNSFICNQCGSIARNRHVAKVILELFPITPPIKSLRDFAKKTTLTILNTCASLSIHDSLNISSNYHVSEFIDGVRPGEVYNGISCQDLVELTYDNNSFDLVITEDVMEHVSDPKKAFKEIGRVLKPNGYHVATIPVFTDQPHSITRAIIHNGHLKHLMPPVYHGDPYRPGGSLVFVDFGNDIADEYCSLTGATKAIWSHGNKFDEENYAIFNSLVFISNKNSSSY